MGKVEVFTALDDVELPVTRLDRSTPHTLLVLLPCGVITGIEEDLLLGWAGNMQIRTGLPFPKRGM